MNIREHILSLITPTTPAAPVTDLPDQVRAAIVQRDRATAALRVVQAERQHLQTAALEGPVDLAGLTEAFTTLDAAVQPAEAAVQAAEARLSALERAAHQVLLQQRREAHVEAQREAEEAQTRLSIYAAEEDELQRQLKELAGRRAQARVDITDCVQRAFTAGQRGLLRRDASLNSGLSRESAPRGMPIRLSEWMRLWDGAQATGAGFIEFTLDIDSGLVTHLVRPNELPGFTVKVNAHHVGEVQR